MNPAADGSSGHRRGRHAKTRRAQQRAAEHAASLGPLHPVAPARGVNQHGEPQLGAEQVFVTRAGTTFHTGWCVIVIDISDQDSRRLLVIDRATVGGRRMCHVCRDDGHLR